jgi:hypothetical protein
MVEMTSPRTVMVTTESGIIAGWWNRLEERRIPLEMFPFTSETVGHKPVKVVQRKKVVKIQSYMKRRNSI